MAEVQRSKKAGDRRSSVGKLDRSALRQFQSGLQRHGRRHRVQLQHGSHASRLALHQLVHAGLHRCHPEKRRLVKRYLKTRAVKVDALTCAINQT